MQLGRNLIVAKVPPNAALNLMTASQSIPPMAAEDAVIDTYVRAYKAAVEDLKKPTPVVRRWDELSAPKVFPQIQVLGGGANATYSPTMTGKIVILLILPNGPGGYISDGERDNALSEVLAGAMFWANTAPASAGLSFVTYYGRIDISAAGNSGCCGANNFPACHDIFVDATLQALGYPTGTTGRDQLVSEYVTWESANGGLIAYITHYTLCWFGYAYFGGGPLFMNYNNDGWGPGQIDRVFAHEVGHTFNAPDEYANCNCGTNYGRGSCTAKNTNCVGCTSSQQNCIMDTNDFTICNYTPKHLGWC